MQTSFLEMLGLRQNKADRVDLEARLDETLPIGGLMVNIIPYSGAEQQVPLLQTANACCERKMFDELYEGMLDFCRSMRNEGIREISVLPDSKVDVAFALINAGIRKVADGVVRYGVDEDFLEALEFRRNPTDAFNMGFYMKEGGLSDAHALFGVEKNIMELHMKLRAKGLEGDFTVCKIIYDKAHKKGLLIKEAFGAIANQVDGILDLGITFPRIIFSGEVEALFAQLPENNYILRAALSSSSGIDEPATYLGTRTLALALRTARL